MSRPPIVFVTAIGTDIGKTYVSVGLIQAARAKGQPVIALKPIISGVPACDDAAYGQSDTGRLLVAQGLSPDQEHIDSCSPWRFRAPLSPDMAAAQEGRTIHFDEVRDWVLSRFEGAPPGALLLLEGVGGLMSPLTADRTNLDLLTALGGRAILVAGNYLGAISHTLTAVEVLRARGVPIEGIILNESLGEHPPLQATLQTLRGFLPDIRITLLERGGQPESLKF